MAKIYFNRDPSLAFVRALDQRVGNGRAPLVEAEHALLTPTEKGQITRALNRLSPQRKAQVVVQTGASGSTATGNNSSTASSSRAQPFSQLSQYPAAAGLDPAQWTVMVNNNRFVQFTSEQQADANISQYGNGTKFRPAPAGQQSTGRQPLPYSNTGWMRVSVGGRTWNFDRAHEADARRCIRHFTDAGQTPALSPYQRTPPNPIPANWQAGFNPPGPTYS